MNAVDLFCGCGGMSWGLKKLGFDVLLGIDSDAKYLQTFSQNFGDERAWHVDVKNVSGKMILERANLQPGELFLLCGGPPCQGFSKNTPRSQRLIDSDNNLLVRQFLRITKELKPQNVIIENVAEMRRGFEGQYTEEIMRELEDMGFSVINHVFDASDYGVPQRRKRTFFVGSRIKKHIDIPKPEFFKLTANIRNTDPQIFDMFQAQMRPKVTVWDAISDLPRMEHTAGEYTGEYLMEPLTEYQVLMRQGCIKPKNHQVRKLADKQFKRLQALRPGEGLKELPDELRTKGGYSGAYGRLQWTDIAPTITRWVFHPGSGRWGHPEDIRTLSIREIARIQSFTDDYLFSGSYTQMAGQLGNAVPPILMQKITQTIL